MIFLCPILLQLPPLKRRRDRDKVTQLSIEAESSNQPLAIEYHDHHSLATVVCFSGKIKLLDSYREFVSF